jgi:hypothetical protein
MSERPYGSLSLPSKGLLYEDKIPDGVIELYDWDTSIEELFAGSIASTNSLIDAILKRTLKTDTMKPDEFLSGDRLYMFFMCRAKAYGSNYGFQYKCSSCGVQYRESVEIPNDLEVIELEDDAVEPFELEMPNGDKLGIRLMRGSDEADIEKYVARLYKKAAPIGDPGYKYRLAKHIVTINDKEVKFKDAQDYISKMTAKDSLAFRKFIDKTEPKFDFKISITCKKCANEDELMLPFGKEFLDPMN